MVDISDIIDNIKEGASDLFSDTRKLIICACGVLALMTLIALLVMLSSKKAAPKTPAKVIKQLVLEDALLIPQAKSQANTYNENYITSRITPDRWSSGDVKEWFDFPTEQQLGDLRKVNDRAAEDLIKAAP